MKSLTEMQQAFIENFSQTGNAKQSAIKAGYSEATAEQQGHNLKKQLSHEIDEATKKLMSSHVPLAVEKLKDLISFGASPRASINLAIASKAYAFIKRRGYVIPEDVRALCYDVLRHRINLTYEAEAENISSEDIIKDILNTVEIP